jgi:hypothetical protein
MYIAFDRVCGCASFSGQPCDDRLFAFAAFQRLPDVGSGRVQRGDRAPLGIEDSCSVLIRDGSKVSLVMGHGCAPRSTESSGCNG